MSAIAALLAPLQPLAVLRPWPRYEVDAATWEAIGRALGAGDGALMALWAEPGTVHLAVRAADLRNPAVVSLAAANNAFPSIGQYHPPALRPERAIRDLTGLTPIGIPDDRPWLDHGAWDAAAPLAPPSLTLPRERGRDGRGQSARDPADYAFLPVHGHGLHQIPVGPVHAGIIEPGHFRFTANGETVARLEQRLGYVHKGIESLLIGVGFDHAGRVVARASGDETVALSIAYARAVEAALGIDVPLRAHVLRGVMAELERIANHVGDVGAICNDAAFALLHAHCGLIRERVLAACDAAFGHRLMMDRVVPGGVTHDLTNDARELLFAMLDDALARFADVVRVYDETPSLQDRTCLTGIVSNELVTQWAAGGFVGRGSGRAFDARRDLAYVPYFGMDFAVPTFAAGDVNARVWVRIREVEESARLLRHWLWSTAEGPLRAEVPAIDAVREGVAVAEAFRGDVFVWVRLAAGRVERAHVRDASVFQWPLLEAAIEGNIVADFPLCNKSFNCSYSGHDQ
ncbi:MAG: hydrogenase expression protein HypE [Hyphomicrobiales bacterium]|nr:hydrogenase expression protein HypE [Hyphomicrobiales bacterium]MBV8826607.1 hydrogenase expression protein HypE [Hyphomicrobiales bacterium]MBV9428780.1 hydrogenase expression protein HypE [Bradyrhizobiaceae bacterium]